MHRYKKEGLVIITSVLNHYEEREHCRDMGDSFDVLMRRTITQMSGWTLDQMLKGSLCVLTHRIVN